MFIPILHTRHISYQRINMIFVSTNSEVLSAADDFRLAQFLTRQWIERKIMVGQEWSHLQISLKLHKL